MARCGTHWMKSILSNLLCLRNLSCPKFNKIPFETTKNFITAIREESDGNIYAGHLPLEHVNPLIGLFNIIAIVRDPRDVCISAAYYLANREPESFEFYLNNLLLKGSPNPPFNNSYITHRKEIPHVLIKYEDMIKDAFGTVCHLLDHFEYSYEENNLKEVLKKESFYNLSGGRKPGEEDNKAFYRKGIIGDWRNYLTDDQNKEFCERNKEFMDDLGYKK
jgi:hypothetical protein